MLRLYWQHAFVAHGLGLREDFFFEWGGGRGTVEALEFTGVYSALGLRVLEKGFWGFGD